MCNWKFWMMGVLVMANLGGEAQAGLFSTTCAKRSVGDAYTDANAVALARAATRGDADEIARLAAQSPKLVNHVENETVPPLFWAICADSVEGFEALLKAGANPNFPASGHGPGDGRGHGRRENGLIIRKGNTPMLIAAESGNEKFLRLAITYGGDLNAKSGEDQPNRPLLMAAYYGLKENLQILLEAGADINVVDEGGETAPLYAIFAGGRFDIAIWLLEQGYSHDLQRLGGGRGPGGERNGHATLERATDRHAARAWRDLPGLGSLQARICRSGSAAGGRGRHHPGAQESLPLSHEEKMRKILKKPV